MAGKTRKRSAEDTSKMKIRKGDRVRIVAGKERTARNPEGRVVKVLPDKQRVVVEGLNVAKKHQKPSRRVLQGGIIDKEMPIHVSNVMLICKSCGPTRVGFTFTDLGKIRVCKKCGDEV